MNQQSPLNKPQMTVMASRPIKVLYQPDGDILVACRTAQGEDVHVPLSALFERFERDMTAKIRSQGGAPWQK